MKCIPLKRGMWWNVIQNRAWAAERKAAYAILDRLSVVSAEILKHAPDGRITTITALDQEIDRVEGDCANHPKWKAEILELADFGYVRSMNELVEGMGRSYLVCRQPELAAQIFTEDQLRCLRERKVSDAGECDRIFGQEEILKTIFRASGPLAQTNEKLHRLGEESKIIVGLRQGIAEVKDMKVDAGDAEGQVHLLERMEAIVDACKARGFEPHTMATASGAKRPEKGRDLGNQTPGVSRT